MHIPISYEADADLVEQILLAAAGRETVKIEELANPTLKALEEQFSLAATDLKPRVYIRLTDNWVELAVRFICSDHDIRGLKDRMSRDIKAKLAAAGIGIASSTYDIVGLPPIKVQMEPPRAAK